MGKKSEKFNFQDYLKAINNKNSNITINNSFYPQTRFTIYDIFNENYKKLIYENVYNRLLNLLLVMYEWETPDNINVRCMELGYVFRGAVCLFKELRKRKKIKIESGMYCLPCATSNIYNIYGDPTQVRVEGFNGYNKNIDIVYSTEIPTNFENYENPSQGYGVYGRDNKLNYPYICYVEESANEITDGILALNIATQKIKNPFMFVAKKPYIKDDINEIFRKIKNNEPVIVITKNGDVELNTDKSKPFEAINIASNPENIKAIEDAISYHFNSFLETIGINTNPSPDKSQVVLTSEINSNNILIDLEQDVRFKQRQKFCKDVKNIFNINLNVKINIPEIQKEIKKTKDAINGTIKTTRNNK